MSNQLVEGLLFVPSCNACWWSWEYVFLEVHLLKSVAVYAVCNIQSWALLNKSRHDAMSWISFFNCFFLAVYFPSCPVRHFLTLFWKVLQKPLCLTTFLTGHRSGGNCFLHHNCRHQVPVQTEYLLCSGPGLRSLQALCQVSVTYLFPEIILDCFCVCVYPTVKIWDSVLLLLKMFLCFKTAGVNLMRRR